MKKHIAKKRIEKIRADLLNCPDFIEKDIVCAGKNISVIFIDEISNHEVINDSILTPIFRTKEKEITLKSLQEKILTLCNCEQIEEKDVEEKILRGFTILFLDGEENALAYNTALFPTRTVEEPPTSTVIRGPREGFTEMIKTNISLVRKRFPDKNLNIEEMIVGKRTKTKVDLIYFNDLVDKKIVEEIKNKINNNKIDGIIDSYYIAKFLEDRPNSLFRQIGNCEKPDIACSKILEGRVLIIVDGSPIALTVPFILLEDFQSANDYYWGDAHRVTLLRIIRIMGLFIAILFPGLYIVLQIYHYKVLPLKFLTTIIITTQNLPLNPFLEIFFIIILFDILFEASIRMPKYLGMAISIVGALILGDTAVKAGLVSPPGVMIVAMSAITVYIIPNQSSQIATLRIVFAIIAGTLGFHGLILGTIFLINYLANIDSFSTPYLAPYAPYIINDQKDGLLKDILQTQKSRPESIPFNKKNSTRLKIKEDKNKKE
ncbi:MAG: spore germination protein [Clostridia bacterium]|nr:spore germination protein [Clostridia bacterium]